MNIFEEARTIRTTMKLGGITQSKLASMMGVSQPYIANKLRLLNFSDRVEKKIIESGISERHARALLRLDDEELQIEAIEKICIGRMNVARCEIMVDSIIDKQCVMAQSKIENYHERIAHFEKSLEYSIALLREFGIKTRLFREQSENKIYINIEIE